MKRIFKKSISLLLALVTALTALCITAAAQGAELSAAPDGVSLSGSGAQPAVYASTASETTETVQITGTCDYTLSYEMLDKVNQERKAQGRSELTMDKDLLDAAMQRAAECSIYFSHTRPSGEDWNTVSSKSNGENVAAGTDSSVDTVMEKLMESSGHRENILNSSYQSIGIGCFTQGNATYWAQVFCWDQAETVSKPSNCSRTFSVTLAPSLFQGALSLTENPAYAIVGDRFELTASIANTEFYNMPTVIESSCFTWSSSDSNTASVNSGGNVFANSIGTARITAKTMNGQLSASANVTVAGTSYASDGTAGEFRKASNGNWYFYVNGRPDYSRFDVIQGSVKGITGWWYVNGGRVDFSYTGVADCENTYGWWYVKDGLVDFTKTGIEPNRYGWWRVVDGKVDFSCNSVEQNEYGWWYLLGGQVQFGYTGVADYANAYGWWYVKDGQVDFSCNSVEQNRYGWWYVLGGQVQFGYTGVADYANVYGWWYVKDGKVDFTKTGVEPNQYGWWRVVDGKVDFSFTGRASNSYGTWYCVDGKVDFSRS